VTGGARGVVLAADGSALDVLVMGAGVGA
jgi:hypothetical protein